MILINNVPLKKSSIFPGGEVHIQLPDEIPEWSDDSGTIVVTTKITNSNELMELILVKNALDNKYQDYRSIYLRLMYVPYARQDRICREGEAFSAKVFANIIDSLNFSKIIVADVHSKIITSSMRTPVKEFDLIDIFGTRAQPVIEDVVLVAPDKGSLSKVINLAEFMNCAFIEAQKVRDKETGKIVGSSLVNPCNAKRFNNKNLLIIDDICDGGGTFLGLAEVLKIYLNPKSISLYVTHGIFSRGLDVLFNAGISKIFTTDSFTKLDPIEDKFHIWKI